MENSSRVRYHCSYVTEIPWLTVSFSILNFAAMGEFLIDLPHAHPFRELLYLESGELNVRIAGDSIIMKKGDLLYVNSQVSHSITATSADTPVTYNASFLLSERASAEKVPQEWIEDERRLVRPLFTRDYLDAHDTNACGEQIDWIKDSIDLHRRGDFVRVKSHISNLLIGALQSFTKIPPDPRYDETVTGEHSYTASAVLLYLHEHFTEGLSLSSVAEALHYSPRQCQRLIQDSMGVSFSELLTELQLSYAKNLLVSTNDNMETISMQAGFSSSRNFYHNFKLRENISPSEYRKLMRLRNAGLSRPSSKQP